MNPSDTAARVNKSFEVGRCEHTPRTNAKEFTADWPMGFMRAGRGQVVDADFARELETEVTALANHPSDEVNRRYIVPLQVAYASAMAERDRLRDILAVAFNQVKIAHRRETDEVMQAGHQMALDMIHAYERDAFPATKPSP